MWSCTLLLRPSQPVHIHPTTVSLRYAMCADCELRVVLNTLDNGIDFPKPLIRQTDVGVYKYQNGASAVCHAIIAYLTNGPLRFNKHSGASGLGNLTRIIGRVIIDDDHFNRKVPCVTRDDANCLANIAALVLDRKSTRLNSSHVAISYAVFCLKKKIQYKLKK